ncbi:monocarboxylate transporter 13-like [Anneissia japonica]|uniref:monocarboxylate transporter 13-like n=1 Tax=Anneissia japonica TaxID=1529436 RepID=UPI001425A5F8|nr:monocarboxylate transporter 13-like [Anneissia japonica]XP_033107329.1 monocarboxylate transporter 13-like [Anneissia japonica]XP_033107330.1 monocarboxylate transporter 13-like [Anneissia japonica]XP_033107331.1 monocarboxylate transporter 13-like [Anneissia japonica]
MSGGSRQHKHIAPPDGGWGWAVVAGSFLCMFISFGYPRNLGLFITPVVDDFESSTGPIGFIVSMPITLLLTTGPLSGVLCKKFGSRFTGILGGILVSTGLAIGYATTNLFYLALGIGVLPGLGLGLAYTASVVIVSRYFEKMFVVANGIIFLGGPISFLVCPFIGETLMELYGWRCTLLLWCAMSLHIIVGGVLMRPVYLLRDLDNTDDNTDNEYELLDNLQEPTSEHQLTNNTGPSGNACTRVWKRIASQLELQLFTQNAMFVLITVVIFLNGFAYESWLIYVIPQAQELNIPDEMSAIILTTTGIGSVVGRLGQIGILHFNILSTYNLWVLANVLAALALITDPLFQNIYSIIVFSVVYGVATGIKMPLAPVLVRDYVGIEKIHVAFGWLNLSRGIGALCGGTSMGILHTYYGSYRQPFVIVAAVQSLAAIILAFKPRSRES